MSLPPTPWGTGARCGGPGLGPRICLSTASSTPSRRQTGKGREVASAGSTNMPKLTQELPHPPFQRGRVCRRTLGETSQTEATVLKGHDRARDTEPGAPTLSNLKMMTRQRQGSDGLRTGQASQVGVGRNCRPSSAQKGSANATCTEMQSLGPGHLL